jgi:hypothetical protein
MLEWVEQVRGNQGHTCGGRNGTPNAKNRVWEPDHPTGSRRSRAFEWTIDEGLLMIRVGCLRREAFICVHRR